MLRRNAKPVINMQREGQNNIRFDIVESPKTQRIHKDEIRELVLNICREALEEFGNIEDTYGQFLVDYELGNWLDENGAWRKFCETLNIKESED